MQSGYSSYGCSFHTVGIWYRYHTFIIADTNTIVKHQNYEFIKVTIKDWMGEQFSGVFKCNNLGRSFKHGKALPTSSYTHPNVYDIRWSYHPGFLERSVPVEAYASNTIR